MICVTQPLVGGMGVVMGLDLTLAVTMAREKGYHVANVIEFLTEANLIYIETKNQSEIENNGK